MFSTLHVAAASKMKQDAQQQDAARCSSTRSKEGMCCPQRTAVLPAAVHPRTSSDAPRPTLTAPAPPAAQLPVRTQLTRLSCDIEGAEASAETGGEADAEAAPQPWACSAPPMPDSTLFESNTLFENVARDPSRYAAPPRDLLRHCSNRLRATDTAGEPRAEMPPPAPLFPVWKEQFRTVRFAFEANAPPPMREALRKANERGLQALLPRESQAEV